MDSFQRPAEAKPGLASRQAKGLTDFTPRLLHQAQLHHSTDFKIPLKSLINADPQFGFLLPIRRNRAERCFDILAEPAIMDPPLSNLRRCNQIHCRYTTEPHKGANLTGMIVDVFRYAEGDLVGKLARTVMIPKPLTDKIPKPGPELRERRANFRLYPVPLYRGTQIELWKTVSTFPAGTGHTLTSFRWRCAVDGCCPYIND